MATADPENKALRAGPPAADSSSDGVSTPVKEKDGPNHIEQIHTNEKVPGHPGYYEKDGLRTYGDDEDHDHEPPVRLLASAQMTRPFSVTR